MAVELFQWQRPSADRLVEIFKAAPVGVNSSDTGAGKSYIALDVAKRLGRKVLIVAPKAVLTMWRRVADDMGVPDLVIDVVNSERLMRGGTPYYKAKRWTPVPMIIWDEVHKGASGPNTITSEMLAMTKVYRVPVLAQSATIADSPLKMRALGWLLGMHDWNKSSFYNWCRRHGCYTSPFHNGLEFPKGPSGAQHMLKIHQAMQPFTVRIRTSEVPEFPECDTYPELFDLDSEYTEEINKIYSEMDAKLMDNGNNPLTELLRARQRTELLKVPLFVDLVTDALEENTSAVVFVSFRETLFTIRDELGKAGIAPTVVYGGQDVKERDEMVAEFQDNKRNVCLCMSQAGGVGISLHDVNQVRPRVAFLSPDYNSVVMKQCLGRIHRAGGTKARQVFVLAAGTIEEKIARAIKAKSACLGMLNDGDLSGGILG